MFLKLYLRAELPFKAKELALKSESCRNLDTSEDKPSTFPSGTGIFLPPVARSRLYIGFCTS